ncbi:MAG: hypothetical protein HDQ88_05780 [Clostridia bacterium]|nr:hypothetical protein [Clostridia bacterium]
MVDRYYLAEDSLPTIPTPHDCQITDIEFDENFLIFKFDNDISKYDSIQFIKPNAKTLCIRIHLVDPVFYAYKYRYKKLSKKEGYFLVDNGKLKDLAKDKNALEYLYHYVGFTSFMIKLYNRGHYLLDVTADYVEFEWTEK